MKNEPVVIKSSKLLSKIEKIHPEAVDPIEQVLVKKFFSRPRPHPHKCSLPILPRNLIHGEKIGITKTSTNLIDVRHLKVKSPSWVKKAPTFRDAWEESSKVSSIQEVAITTPSAIITSKGPKKAGSKPKPFNVPNSAEKNVLQYRKLVSEYTFKSPFPIQKLAANSSSDWSFDNSRSPLQPALTCDCVNSQVPQDSHNLPRVIFKDSANFGKFRRDIDDTELLSRNSDSSTGSRPDEGYLSNTNIHRGMSGQPYCKNANTNQYRKSAHSLFSTTTLDDRNVQVAEHQQCALNDGYVVKRIIYSVEDNVGRNSTRNRPRKSNIFPGIGG